MSGELPMVPVGYVLIKDGYIINGDYFYDAERHCWTMVDVMALTKAGVIKVNQMTAIIRKENTEDGTRK